MDEDGTFFRSLTCEPFKKEDIPRAIEALKRHIARGIEEDIKAGVWPYNCILYVKRLSTKAFAEDKKEEK
jgi:hypothetical protein